MNPTTRLCRTVLAPVLLLAAVAAPVLTAGSAQAVSATKVELKGGQLKVEGRAAPGGTRVVAESTTSSASVRSDQNGLFRIQAGGFTAPDCRLTLRDNSTPTATVSIPGCTPSITPVPANPAPPTGGCVLTPQPSATTLRVGTSSVFWFYATGCSPESPLSYTVVAGAIPTGMSVGTYQTSGSGNVIGVPSIPGTYRFTVQVTDAAGARDQETFTVVVS